MEPPLLRVPGAAPSSSPPPVVSSLAPPPHSCADCGGGLGARDAVSYLHGGRPRRSQHLRAVDLQAHAGAWYICLSLSLHSSLPISDPDPHMHRHTTDGASGSKG
ncbi:hypothetical protein PVAP13_4NG186511 [Panicum virgatum]|uniref:Uncharacterized protein n=1 Tax=Panicum virgatum TaxID=38727 RepID=A0A8T0T9X4_PANVG|nr:hypothetical protein PVAP13_4NG186511 [Panicum virgatum]